MKPSTIKLTKMDDYQCIRPGGTIIQTIKWALLLVITPILYLSIPSAGHGTEDPLTLKERVWLNQHNGKIVVNNEAGWPPIIDTDKDGNSFGIVMDYQ